LRLLAATNPVSSSSSPQSSSQNAAFSLSPNRPHRGQEFRKNRKIVRTVGMRFLQNRATVFPMKVASSVYKNGRGWHSPEPRQSCRQPGSDGLHRNERMEECGHFRSGQIKPNQGVFFAFFAQPSARPTPSREGFFSVLSELSCSNYLVAAFRVGFFAVNPVIASNVHPR
jgi:hypothetical protein